MLTKSQKVVMFVISLVTIIMGVITCIPFRTIAAENTCICSIFKVEAIVKFVVFPLIALAFTLYVNLKKYKQIYNREERSKVVNLLSYLPILVQVASVLVLLVHTLTFKHNPVSEVAHSILLVFGTCYLVAALCAIPLVSKLSVKLSRKKNIILDTSLVAILVCFMLVVWKVLSVYAKAGFEGYVYGASNNDPYLFVLYVILFFSFVFSISKLFKIVRTNETVVFAAILTDENLSEVIKEEYDKAYNDILDDFENYFENEIIEEVPVIDEEDEVEEIEEEPAIEEVHHEQVVQEVHEEIVEEAHHEEVIEEVAKEEVETLAEKKVESLEDLHELNQLLEETDSMNDEKMAEQAENIKKQIEVEKNALAQERAELEDYRSRLMAEISALQEQVDEIEDSQVEVVDVKPAAKKKVFKPTFEQIVTFAKSLQDETWKITEKINPDTGTGTIKFTKEKVQFLVLQSTNSDYRITFMATEKKWSTILTSVKGVTIPKNAKANNLLKFVNKGIAETSVVKSFIRESVKGVNEEIARIEKAKAEEKLRKAEAKKAAKLAEKAAEENK